ncbi:ribosomal protein S12 methylthiotransferase accessory factor [Streptomyces sp. 2112.3]|nr:ribosomal protein S12 methylthiotransferase accessory factor [Streptomyces sp. 2321.6]SDR32514.1 ribosomal protein S12 methylthiotransferase accessory factor [Streptomyces sp. KS_16]SED26902.1 ribosomal protein S12 methylthiotransferase accessory factor [Streptomyces sp. 2133.1]SEE56536.1 ribosomal protein S12 methylthiotransferase accessory factor [Streptomyces sp. 2112.3]SNC70392.1 ribosomal protein S12 methylthiotransferase accessory factor [Streptomyces sp. 2114.4]
MTKVRLPGTHRAVGPDTTWSRLSPQLSRYGITRIADVTRLDDIGIPVVLAVRPASETLAVSQGKGASKILAKLSAVMESIELWHAERPPLEPFAAPAESLGLPYALTDLNLRTMGAWADKLRLSWVWTRPVLGGDPVPAPWDLVQLSYSGDHFTRPKIFHTSSTGLASGNTFTEACLHGMYEAIERDVLAGRESYGGNSRLLIDPRTIRDEHLVSLLDRLSRAGVEVHITCLPNRFGVPTFTVLIWSPLFPVVCAGSGTHMDANVALSRAVTEAAQSRLTEISSTRDDIPSGFALPRDACAAPGFRPHDEGIDFADAVRGQGGDFDDMEWELKTVVGRVNDAVGHEPLVADLSTQPDLFRVVRVVCPGLAYTEGRTLA